MVALLKWRCFQLARTPRQIEKVSLLYDEIAVRVGGLRPVVDLRGAQQHDRRVSDPCELVLNDPRVGDGARQHERVASGLVAT